MDRFRRRNSYRALTLLELLLASTFVSLLAALMFMLTRGSTTVQKKAWLVQDSQQAVHLALERLREELAGARVSTPVLGGDSPILGYLKVESRDGLAVLDSFGQPSWLGPFEVSLTSEGALVSSRENRFLSRLGEEASVRFQRPEARRLVVSLTAERGDKGNGQQFSTSKGQYEFFLRNI